VDNSTLNPLDHVSNYMDIEKLITEYISLKWELLDAHEEKRQSVEDKIASIKAQLEDAGVISEATGFSHEKDGGIIVGLKSETPLYYCVHCHKRGDIDVRYEHDFSGYAIFMDETRD